MAISKELKRCLDERRRNAEKAAQLEQRNKELDRIIEDKQRKDAENWANALVPGLMKKLEEMYGECFWYELTATEVIGLLSAGIDTGTQPDGSSATVNDPITEGIFEREEIE